MKKVIFPLLLCFIIIQAVSAQDSRFSMGMYITIDDALQAYDDNLETNPVGISFSGMYHLPNSKISLGSAFGVAMYTNDQYTEDLSGMGYDNSYATVDEEDCYFSYSVFARYNLMEAGPITPYAEVRFGGNSFFSSKEYSDISGSAPDQIDPEFDFHGTSFKSGIGGGLMINFGRFRSDPRTSRVSIDLGATINNGSSATYRSLIERNNGPLTNEANYYNSKTNNIVYRIGAAFRF